MRLIAFVAVCLALAACHPPDYSYQLAQVEHTPLAFDPTDEVEIGRWWFNGEQLLRLDPNGGYVIHPGPNRYHPPIERGFWSQQSFAVLRFAPYQTSPEWIRVAVTKNDGVIALHVPKLDTMFSIPGPPAVVEDELVGIWVDVESGRHTTLRLDESGRFTYAPTIAGAGAAGRPAIAVGHQGSWRVIRDQAWLFPDPANLDPYHASLERDREMRRVIGLDTGAMQLRRASDEFASPTDAPD